MANMFDVTFLGHQGWLFSTGRTHVLMDPLLLPGFGHDPRGHGFDVFPPRTVELTRCPPIDGVLISHEHEDHLDIPSLELLDRKIPIHLSALSSNAARSVLAELGFEVHLLRPGSPFAIGDLGVLPMPQQSLAGGHPGEWDSLAVLVRDRAGHGSFFTTVDHRPHAGAFELLRRHGERATVVAYADNESDYSALFPWARGAGTEGLVTELRAVLDRAAPRDSRPEAIVLCANGYAARGELAFMNRIFHRDPRAACTIAGEAFTAPLPGETIRMVRRRVTERRRPSPWIAAAPEAAWPLRGAAVSAPVADVGPASRLALEPREARARLSLALDDLARALYGSSLFQELYLLGADELAGRRPTFVLVLRERQGSLVEHWWVWDPSGCRFVCEEPKGDATSVFVAGARCWASDLLEVLEASMPAASLTVGRLSAWNALPERLRFDLPNALHVYCHPLRVPERFAAMYRGLVRGSAPVVRASRS